MCKVHPEPLHHLLFDCAFLLELWKTVLPDNDFPKLAKDNDMVWFSAWNSMSKLNFARVWTIWKCRNKLLFQNWSFSIWSFRQEWCFSTSYLSSINTLQQAPAFCHELVSIHVDSFILMHGS